MKLPRADQAIIDIAKLHDYSLNLLHPEGKHKARVFAASMGFSAADAGKTAGYDIRRYLSGGGDSGYLR
jgi:hypothetical protein